MGEDEAQGQPEKPEHEGADVEGIAEDVIQIADATARSNAHYPGRPRNKPSPGTPQTRRFDFQSPSPICSMRRRPHEGLKGCPTLSGQCLPSR